MTAVNIFLIRLVQMVVLTLILPVMIAVIILGVV